MNLIILYASILIQGQTMNLEFKNALFKTQKDCKYYLSRHEDFVMDTLNIHLKDFYPKSTLLYVDCTDKSNFEDLNKGI